MSRVKALVKEVMDRAVAEDFVAGVNLLVVKQGAEVLYAQSGFIDKENRLPIERNSIFRLYSMSKPITAAAVMILIERGQISLCDPVSLYISTFENQTVLDGTERKNLTRPMRIRDLLSMQSGLSYGDTGTEAGRCMKSLLEEVELQAHAGKTMSTLEFAERIGSFPLEFQPGERFFYGTSADVLGAIIEIVSGMKFSEFLQKEIFTPLKMKDTGFYVPEEKRNRLAKVYTPGEGGLIEDRTNNLGIRYELDCPPAFESGGAGLVSTISDYEKFAAMLLHGGRSGEARILNEKTVSWMMQSQETEKQKEEMWGIWDNLRGYGYGNLNRICTDPGLAYSLACKGEYGWDGWVGPYLANFPKQKLTFLMMIQKSDAATNRLTRELRNIIISHYADGEDM